MKIIHYILASFVILSVFSCEKATTPSPKVLKETMPKVGSDEYYANLRAYKKSDHSVCFGWWMGSGGSTNSDMSTRYISLPDSMDIISMWGGYPKDEIAWKELRYCQKVKGTRFVICMFGSSVDKMMNEKFPDLVQQDVMLAIDAVASAINDTIVKYQLDGFDLDYEPNFGDGGIFGHGKKDEGGDIYTQRLFQALSKFMGPKSGTDKLLIIDGENEPGIVDYIDYLAQQAYGTGSDASLQWRYERYGFNGKLPPEKFIVTENMQQYGGHGHGFWRNGKDIGSVLGMAYWNPNNGRKGGFGGYIIDSDYYSERNHPYSYLRKGIQIQNPAVR